MSFRHTSINQDLCVLSVYFHDGRQKPQLRKFEIAGGFHAPAECFLLHLQQLGDSTRGKSPERHVVDNQRADVVVASLCI